MTILKHYVVSWSIDIYATSPHDAAKAAAAFMKRGFTPDDDVFDVTECVSGTSTSIDLSEPRPIPERKLHA